jgi:hypothetical protein
MDATREVDFARPDDEADVTGIAVRVATTKGISFWESCG